MKQLSFLNDSFIVKSLKKLKKYADESLFFHFDFSVHHAKTHQKPYETQVSSGFFYKLTGGIDSLLGKFEGFLAKAVKESFIGSKILGGLSECQNEAIQSLFSLFFGFGVGMLVLYPNKKLGLGLLALSIIGMALNHMLKDKVQYSWLYRCYHKIFKAGDAQ